MDWERIYTEHRPAMIEAASRRTGEWSDVDAADLVHEAFVAVLSDPPVDEPNWPDLLTARMAEACAREPVVDEEPVAGGEPVEDTATVAVRRLAADEVRQRILRVMGYMTERQREITRLRLFEGLSVGEIAARVNTSSSNVSQIVIRCLVKLAPSLTQFDTVDHRDLERVRPPRRLH